MQDPLPAYKGDQPFVFVCYAHTDKALVYPEIRWLQEQGLNVWYDEGISGGTIWRAQIGDAIDAATHFLLFLSADSLQSDHCSREVNLALDENKPVVPVYVEEVALTSELKVGLSRLHALHLTASNFRLSLLEAVGFAGSGAESSPEPATPTRSIKRWVAPVGIALTVLILLVSLTYWQWRTDPRPTVADVMDRPVVAVLPFTNVSGDGAYDYLSLGLMDEVIVNLHRFKSFPVVARSAALNFQGRNEPITAMAAELQASYVVDSSLTTDGDTLRILATMSDSTGVQVWAKRFELASDLGGFFAIVDELAAAIAGAVQDSQVDRVIASKRPPVAAWEHYMKGLSMILNWQPDRYAEAVSSVERALELEPDLAEAWWALGEIEAVHFMESPPAMEDQRPQIETIIGYFRRAHELSPFHAGACGCLGFSLAALGREEEAFVVFSEALAANPMSPQLRVDYAQVLASQSRFDEARQMAESAVPMVPNGKDLALSWMVRGLADFGQGQWDSARQSIRRATFVHAQDPQVTPYSIVMLYVLGDRDEAKRLYSPFIAAFPTHSLDNPLTALLRKPIDRVIVSERAAGRELPPDSLAIIEELAKDARLAVEN